MCARFTLTVPDFAALAELLRLDVDPEIAALYRPRYNIAPAQTHLVLRLSGRKRALVPATFGLIPRGGGDGARPAASATGAPRPGDRAQILVNARSETARTKPTFRAALAARRCVIPADGFYEWTGEKGARRPLWFHPARGGLLHLAGLYEPARPAQPASSTPGAPAGQAPWMFTILTTAANAEIAPFHDRMPVLLEPSDIDHWLDTDGVRPEQAEALLRPARPGTLSTRAVSTRVNGVVHDDPSLILEALAEREVPPDRKVSPGRKVPAKREVPAEIEGTLPLFAPRGPNASSGGTSQG